jgi:putative transposase
VLTGNGAVQIGVPRDREGSFEPQLVARHQRRLPDFDERVLGLYARGLSVREVKSFLEDQYKTDVSADLISRVTDAVSDDVIEWQNRPLNGLYPVVYLDAIHVKMRQDRVVRSRAFYVVLAINMEGHKEVLGLWSSDNEGAAFWLGVLTELKNRGLNDILVACCDGLSGLPEAIRTAFPNTIVQTCVVHKIRASLKYVNWKERKAVARDLKPIYRAATEEAGLAALDDFDKLWGKTYPTIAPSWRRDWDLISPFFEFPEEIRRVIYTTNTIEALNRQLRKVIKTRGVFPTEKAVMKVMYLAIHQAVRKWSMPVKDWGSAMQQFAIRFEGRVNL